MEEDAHDERAVTRDVLLAVDVYVRVEAQGPVRDLAQAAVYKLEFHVRADGGQGAFPNIATPARPLACTNVGKKRLVSASESHAYDPSPCSVPQIRRLYKALYTNCCMRTPHCTCPMDAMLFETTRQHS